jgi:hypothetical protein
MTRNRSEVFEGRVRHDQLSETVRDPKSGYNEKAKHREYGKRME